MKKTLNTYDIVNELNNDRDNNGYSYAGCKALANYLEQEEEDLREELELDVVAIRCDYTQYHDFLEVNEYYDLVDFDDDDDEDKIYKIKEKLEEDGIIFIEFDDGVIIRDF